MNDPDIKKLAEGESSPVGLTEEEAFWVMRCWDYTKELYLDANWKLVDTKKEKPK